MADQVGTAKQIKIAIQLTGEEQSIEYDTTWTYDINGPSARGFVRVWKKQETHYYPIERIRRVVTRN